MINVLGLVSLSHIPNSCKYLVTFVSERDPIVLITSICTALPSRDRYLEAREEREYENSRPQRRRPLSDVENGYVASTQEPVMRQGSTPMAAQALPYYDNEMIIMIISQTTINVWGLYVWASFI